MENSNINPDYPVNIYDLCFAWNWEHDRDFVQILAKHCRDAELHLLTVTSQNLEEVLAAVEQRTIVFRAFWDRASDNDEKFTRLQACSHSCATVFINPPEKARRAWNKATMHLELITAGVQTPYTILIDPYTVRPELDYLDLSVIGSEFIIKPAHGGGGEGVIHNANSLQCVHAARQEHPNDFYLLQARIQPVYLHNRPAWLRIISCFGQHLMSWWNPTTHIYQPFSEEDAALIDCGKIHRIMDTIAGVCGLDLFSSEIVLSEDGRYVVVDYINDPIDLRLQSKAADGVPDIYIEQIASAVVDFLKKQAK